MSVSVNGFSSKILVVEDEVPIAKLLRYNLENEGYAVDIAYDGEAAKELINSTEDYSAIILDRMLPKSDGVSVCQMVRDNPKTKKIPIIMLSALVGHNDRIAGLESGADDYVTKPFVPRELTARIRAVIRRCSQNNVTQEVLKVRDLTMDMNRMQVFVSGKYVQVSVKEFKLLKLFMANPGIVFRRERLLQLIWGEGKDIDIRTVDVHINRLRNALGLNSQNQSYIRTVRGSGYSLNIENEEAMA